MKELFNTLSNVSQFFNEQRFIYMSPPNGPKKKLAKTMDEVRKTVAKDKIGKNGPDMARDKIQGAKEKGDTTVAAAKKALDTNASNGDDWINPFKKPKNKGKTKLSKSKLVEYRTMLAEELQKPTNKQDRTRLVSLAALTGIKLPPGKGERARIRDMEEAQRLEREKGSSALDDLNITVGATDVKRSPNPELDSLIDTTITEKKRPKAPKKWMKAFDKIPRLNRAQKAKALTFIMNGLKKYAQHLKNDITDEDMFVADVSKVLKQDPIYFSRILDIAHVADQSDGKDPKFVGKFIKDIADVAIGNEPTLYAHLASKRRQVDAMDAQIHRKKLLLEDEPIIIYDKKRPSPKKAVAKKVVKPKKTEVNEAGLKRTALLKKVEKILGSPNKGIRTMIEEAVAKKFIKGKTKLGRLADLLLKPNERPRWKDAHGLDNDMRQAYIDGRRGDKILAALDKAGVIITGGDDPLEGILGDDQAIARRGKSRKNKRGRR